jgi:putative transposase
MCAVLKEEYGVSIAASSYHAYKRRKPSQRASKDARLSDKIRVVYEQNYSCYGVIKVWHALLNDGENVARCTVERLMRKMGLKGARRGKIKRTTIPANRHTADDLVRRNFHADAPNELWVADFTYISTWQGWCYTAFVVDVFARRIIGHNVSSLMNEQMVTAAFSRAMWTRAKEGHDGLAGAIHHSDKGSQYTADDFRALLEGHGIQASIGTVGDSYDNALAETINGAYKTELIKRQSPWKTFSQLEYETAKWVDWYNKERISQYNNFLSPTEIERLWYSDGVDARRGSKRGKA